MRQLGGGVQHQHPRLALEAFDLLARPLHQYDVAHPQAYLGDVAAQQARLPAGAVQGQGAELVAVHEARLGQGGPLQGGALGDHHLGELLVLRLQRVFLVHPAVAGPELALEHRLVFLEPFRGVLQ